MTNKLTLAINNPAIKPSTWTTDTPSHLDTALSNGFLLDVMILTISPDATAPGGFHLALKSQLEGAQHPLWINLFGPKEFLAGRAVDAIDAVLAGQPPKRRIELGQWKTALADYSWSGDRLLMLPG